MPLRGAALSLTYLWRGVWRTLGPSFLVCSCGSGNFSEESGHLDLQVIHGDTSPADQNAVVVVRNTRTGYWTTGSLVAPRLVLTSKRLLFELTRESMSFYCNNDSSGTPSLRVLDADDFEVMFGETFPMRTGNGVRIYAGAVLDLCRSDVALLQIDDEFPITPLALRLDSLPLVGEEGVLIGWGMSNESAQIPPGSSVTPMGRRHQASLRIEAVGPTVFPVTDGGSLGVLESTFVTAEGGCFGDAGAPFLSSKTQAIVGTLSVLEPENATDGDTLNPFRCFRGYTTFRSLAPEREWILEAFHEAGATAWLEGSARPADVGSGCKSDEECASGHCLMARSGGFCSTPCDDASCAQGQQCLVIDEGEWCVPERLESRSVGSAACGVAQGARVRSAPSSVFPFVVLLVARRRLRRAKCEVRSAKCERRTVRFTRMNHEP